VGALLGDDVIQRVSPLSHVRLQLVVPRYRPDALTLDSPNSSLCQRFDLVAPGTCRTEGASGGPGSVALAGQEVRTSSAYESSGCTTSGTLPKSCRCGGRSSVTT
jgi:hypothetical protein